jgi:hypothetical protein
VSKSRGLALIYCVTGKMTLSAQWCQAARFLYDSGMDFIMGEARFVGDRTVDVALTDGGSRTLCGANVSSISALSRAFLDRRFG